MTGREFREKIGDYSKKWDTENGKFDI